MTSPARAAAGERKPGYGGTVGVGQAPATRWRYSPGTAGRMKQNGGAAGTSAERSVRVARGIGEVLSPPWLTVATVVVLALHASSSIVEALGWSVLTGGFVAILPYLVLLLGVRRGRWSDRHLRRRQDRVVPLAIALVSALVGAVLLVLLDAPRSLQTGVLSLIAGLVVVSLITPVWKVSLHLAVAAGAVAVLLRDLGSVAWWGAPLVVLLAWARVRTGSHTPAQVLVGAVVGVAAVLAVQWGPAMAG